MKTSYHYIILATGCKSKNESLDLFGKGTGSGKLEPVILTLYFIDYPPGMREVQRGVLNEIAQRTRNTLNAKLDFRYLPVNGYHLRFCGLLADDPTGSVDAKTSVMILDLFRELGRSLGITIVIVTHDLAISRKVDRIVAIRDGKVSSEFIRRSFYSKELSGINGLKSAEEADGAASHIEMVVMDKTGRLQLPKEYVEDFKARGVDKLIVSHEGGKIVLSEPGKNGGG